MQCENPNLKCSKKDVKAVSSVDKIINKGSSREIKKICSDIIDLFSKIKIVGFICQEII